MTPPAYEVNLDGLVGPTHNYAGLALGNTASQEHGGTISDPRKAALEGLAKMNLLASLGLKQAILPPQERPDTHLLRQLGFTGHDKSVLEQARRYGPGLLAAACSASSMWAANAATVSPSADTRDGRVHFTAANLISQLHRSIEPVTTTAILRAIFKDQSVFTHHTPLPPALHLSDEGAANHTRLCRGYDAPGVEVFVYGREMLNHTAPRSRIFPARQTREASTAIARLHGLDPQRTVFAQQNPEVIDAGVFHNDVIAVGHRNVLLYHSDAFVDTPTVVQEIRQKYARVCHDELVCIEVPPDQLSVTDAVGTYLFNSQLVSLPDGSMSLVCPTECRQHTSARQYLEQIVAADNAIGSIRYVAVRQSMRNGGGPACLRLRVVLTHDQIDKAHQGVFFTESLHEKLTAWVNRYYRDKLRPDDLADPKLLDESREALDTLTRILGLGSLYPFQQSSG